MEERHLIAYCGVNCAVCPDYLNKVCPCCRDSVWKEGDECPPVACCKKQGIGFCAYCPTFPCDSMREFYGESDGHRDAYRRMCAMREQS